MATIIKPKQSNTSSSVPTTSDLADGEIAVNTADKKIYVRNSTNIIEVANYSAEATIITDYGAITDTPQVTLDYGSIA